MSKPSSLVSTSGWVGAQAQGAEPLTLDQLKARLGINEINYCFGSSTMALGFMSGKQSDVFPQDLKASHVRRVVIMRMDDDRYAIVKMLDKPSGGHGALLSPECMKSATALGHCAAFDDAAEATPLDVHDFIQAGIPRSELVKTLRAFPNLCKDDLLPNALGVSLRTIQRMQVDSDKNMSVEQAGRLITFKKIISLAIEVLASQPAAENWLLQKAIGLDQRRPLELMTTDVGSQAVHTLLEQIDAGVYV
jgi:putative toxin-antitoxin system antitoxin component (TIGR02293 family)